MTDISLQHSTGKPIKFKILIIKVLLILWLIYFSLPLTNVDEIQLQASLLGLFGN